MLPRLTRSHEETVDLGRWLGQILPKGSIVCFSGDLAAGKTTLIKGIVEAATGTPADDVPSPTFVYLNIYPGLRPVYHFDLYRLRDAEEFLALGFEEFFFTGGITCIEWSERIRDILPSSRVEVLLEHRGENLRCVTFRGI